MTSHIVQEYKQDTADAPHAGLLYGVGVGPGDPELLTLRAVRVLNEVSVLFAAASPKNEDSLALSIAAPHLRAGVKVLRLDFPMTRDSAILREAWERNASTVLDVLHSGRDGAFLTLGDPLIYSTFGYLMRAVLDMDPNIEVRIVPGVTSFQEAAARSRTVLCQGAENLLLLSGINGAQRLDQALEAADSAVILKAYKNAAEIAAVAGRGGRAERALFASRLGLEGEVIEQGCAALQKEPHYLSLLLLPPDRRE
ncbi:precorrin-2 C(20)-methyltransferase [Desulfovibrio sp. OttesenSCG-928-G11]|nr:precorrin-2 C(20)-methyltransferase [Desulfovibrio sp. OttesenSCG-928-G11]